MTSKGPELKLDQDHKLEKHIEKEIYENKKSPEVVAVQLSEYGFNIKLSVRTIRNAIYSGIIFDTIKLISTSDKFITDNVSVNSESMFSGDNKLIGGAGTVYDANYVDKTYARVDGGTSLPGYFTLKTS